jgi:hypothetical protein
VREKWEAYIGFWNFKFQTPKRENNKIEQWRNPNKETIKEK